MKNKITYYHYDKKKIESEKVWGEEALCYLYSKNWVAKTLLFLLARFRLASFLFGIWQNLPFSKRKIPSFLSKYQIDTEEFVQKPEEFRSFNDFFIRKLHPSCRPFPQNPYALAAPADGRYRFFSHIAKEDYFPIKGVNLNVQALLGESLSFFEGGDLVLIRLCPTDYHRYHFPCTGSWIKRKRIRGSLYSVSPLAYLKKGEIFLKNERIANLFDTPRFGQVGLVEVGATCVGKIHRTHLNERFSIGEEMGYFSFGGSSLVLLFQKGKAQINPELFSLSKEREVYLQAGHLLQKP